MWECVRSCVIPLLEASAMETINSLFGCTTVRERIPSEWKWKFEDPSSLTRTWSDLEQYSLFSSRRQEMNPKYEPNFASQTYFVKVNIFFNTAKSDVSGFFWNNYYSFLGNMS